MRVDIHPALAGFMFFAACYFVNRLLPNKRKRSEWEDS